jgi:hypothetical protein
VVTPLESWIRRGKNQHVVIKRWDQGAAALDAASVAKLRRVVQSWLGRRYDARFLWSDEEIYCSELVWKSYQRALDVELVPLGKYRDFNLDHPAVRKLLQERFAGAVPLDEPVVPPSALFASPKLVEVARGGRVWP